VSPAAKYGRGDSRLLTNGVRGANGFKVLWLGGEGVDADSSQERPAICISATLIVGPQTDPSNSRSFPTISMS
jgi:hypothetical protein